MSEQPTLKQTQQARLIFKFEQGIVDKRLFSLIMRNGVNDCEPFLKFLDSDNILVRLYAVKIFARFSDSLQVLSDILVKEIKNQEQFDVVDLIIRILGEHDEYTETISKLMTVDSAFLNLFLEQIKRNGKVEYVTALLFSGDDKLVKAIKGLMENVEER